MLKQLFDVANGDAMNIMTIQYRNILEYPSRAGRQEKMTGVDAKWYEK